MRLSARGGRPCCRRRGRKNTVAHLSPRRHALWPTHSGSSLRRRNRSWPPRNGWTTGASGHRPDAQHQGCRACCPQLPGHCLDLGLSIGLTQTLLVVPCEPAVSPATFSHGFQGAGPALLARRPNPGWVGDQGPQEHIFCTPWPMLAATCVPAAQAACELRHEEGPLGATVHHDSTALGYDADPDVNILQPLSRNGLLSRLLHHLAHGGARRRCCRGAGTWPSGVSGGAIRRGRRSHHCWRRPTHWRPHRQHPVRTGARSLGPLGVPVLNGTSACPRNPRGRGWETQTRIPRG